MNTQTLEAIKLFKNDLYFRTELEAMPERTGMKLSECMKVIANGAMDGDGNFGDIVGWDELDKIDFKEVTKHI